MHAGLMDAIFWLGLGIILPAAGYAVSLIQPCTGQ
jgi:hypothetical protein